MSITNRSGSRGGVISGSPCSLVFLALTFLINFSLGQKGSGQSRNEPVDRKPNIILIMADDLGWNDVGFHGSNQIPTPNIDALAYNGVILNNHYSQSLCTPSRSALLTGRYPIHTGMQHNVILSSEPWGLPLKERLLSEELKANGYSTHMIGKWHLGFYKKEYTPTYRGFDTHYGFWTGLQDYYNHQSQDTNVVKYVMRRIWPALKFQPYEGIDMRRGMDVDFTSTGRYSTDLFTEEAERIIDEHSNACGGTCNQPLFLYVAFSAPHCGNFEDPLQAPAEVISKFSFIKDEERRKYAAMVWKLDESVGRIVSALDKASMLDNSIIVFISDNGAQTHGIHYNKGSNYPLKGEKISPWEGGVRTVALAWSPKIKHPGRVSNQLMHISDWMPTLVAAAGGDVTSGQDRLPVDGVDMGPAIFEAAASQSFPPPATYDLRNEVLINIDDSSRIVNYAAIRIGDYKLIDGTTLLGFQDHWVGETGRGSGVPLYNGSSVTSSRASKALRPRMSRSLSDADIDRIRDSAGINCNALWPPKGLESHKTFSSCLPLFKPCLFDVVHDPCEKRNLYTILPDVAKNLKIRLDELRRTAKKPNNIASDPNANPKYWNETWTNWGDYPTPEYKLNVFRLPFFG